MSYMCCDRYHVEEDDEGVFLAIESEVQASIKSSESRTTVPPIG